MRITGLKADKRAPGCLVIEVDGARFATLSAEAVRELALSPDRPLEREAVEQLRYVADVEAAYRVAVRMLATRPRSVNEVLRRLRDRGHNPSAVAQAVGRLETKGLLDDVEFAAHFARVRSARGHGPARLLTDLLAKGVERRIAERAIDRVLDAEGVDPLDQARALAVTRASRMNPGLPRETRKRRLLGYLARRGYRGREVTELVDGVVGG